MKKIIIGGLIILMLVLTVFALTTFEPIKDSKVSSSQPTTNFGSGTIMMVKDKSIAKDRSYIGFDLSSSGLPSVNNANLELFVYWTTPNIVGKNIQAWYCNNTDFTESIVHWNNQPANWDSNGNHLTNNCVLADSYTATNSVYAGTPETKHVWDLTTEVNNELANGDGKFTVVLKLPTEKESSTTQHWVQYLTRDYLETQYRPQLVIS